MAGEAGLARALKQVRIVCHYIKKEHLSRA
jgi:hypothetical protein